MKPPKASVDAREAALVYSIEAGFERLTAEMASTRNAVTLRGAEAKPLTGAAQLVTVSACRLLGFAIRETVGIAASLLVYDGDGGELVAPIALAAGESAREWWGPGGVGLTRGAYVTVTGSIEGTLFVGPGGA